MVSLVCTNMVISDSSDDHNLAVTKYAIAGLLLGKSKFGLKID